MLKYVIECLNCGKYASASNGFLGIGKTRNINCSCGYTINIATDKTTSRKCLHCGNAVLFDQSKGEKAVCPVCKEKINTIQDLNLLININCPNCSCNISEDKTLSLTSCPLCNTEIDVQKQLYKQKIKEEGLVSLIKFEGTNDVFVWKHPIEDFNCGSQLIVHEQQEALFFRDGKALDLFGAGRYTLATQSLPMLEKLYKLPTNNEDVFHSEVYFINLTTQMGVKWGTDSKVRLFDPASGLYIEVGAHGTFNIRVCDSRKLILKIVGTTSNFMQDDINGTNGVGKTSSVGKFKSLIINKVKTTLATKIKENNINILEIDSQLDILSESIKQVINKTLEEYGLTMPEFFIDEVVTPDDDPNFKKLKEQFAEKILKVRAEEIRKAEAEEMQKRKLVEAQTEAQMKLVEAQANAEAYRLKAMVEAEEMRMKGYTYSQETSRMIGLETMKNGLPNGGTVGGMTSSIGELAGLGVSLGAMSNVAKMTQDIMTPMMQQTSQMGKDAFGSLSGWNCDCGRGNIDSRFCPDCGKAKPAEGWTCNNCKKTNIKTNFCPDCGSPPPAKEEGWNCSCGRGNINSGFCPDCGKKKPSKEE